MKQTFNKIKAKCVICGTPLNGDNLLKRGDKYYCQAHYEITSPQEKSENDFIKRKKKNYDKIFGQT